MKRNQARVNARRKKMRLEVEIFKDAGYPLHEIYKIVGVYHDISVSTVINELYAKDEDDTSSSDINKFNPKTEKVIPKKP